MTVNIDRGRLAIGPTATADLIIETISSWGNRVSNSWDAIAQTLVVPSDKPTLSTFEFGVETNDFGDTFRVRLFEWDRNVEHVVGPELFSTDAILAPIELTFIEIEIDTSLVGGLEYAVIVEWDQDPSGSGVAFIESLNPYADGYANFTMGPIDEPWNFAHETGFDMAFRAAFTPAPGAFVLLAGAGLLRCRRR